MIEIDEPSETKYIVFKMEDWESFGGPEWMGATPIDDAVVIRLKDPFAATALFTYNNTIMNALDNNWIPEEDQERMLEIADYFHQQAVESSKIKNKRLPD